MNLKPLLCCLATVMSITACGAEEPRHVEDHAEDRGEAEASLRIVRTYSGVLPQHYNWFRVRIDFVLHNVSDQPIEVIAEDFFLEDVDGGLRNPETDSIGIDLLASGRELEAELYWDYKDPTAFVSLNYRTSDRSYVKAEYGSAPNTRW